MANLNPVIASSVNPKEISLVLKGALVAVAPLMALIIKAAGGEISNEELQSVVDAAADIVTAVGSIASLGMMAYGVIRKVVNSFSK
jgi:hypothetical protein